MAPTKVTQAPYSRFTGALLHWARPTHTSAPATFGRVQIVVEPDWRPNRPFRAAMVLQPGLTTGRSAKYVHWRDPDGRDHPMFVADLVGLVAVGHVDRGRCEGPWMVAKRGQNYGLRLARVDEYEGLV